MSECPSRPQFSRDVVICFVFDFPLTNASARLPRHLETGDRCSSSSELPISFEYHASRSHTRWQRAALYAAVAPRPLTEARISSYGLLQRRTQVSTLGRLPVQSPLGSLRWPPEDCGQMTATTMFWHLELIAVLDANEGHRFLRLVTASFPASPGGCGPKEYVSR